MPVSAAGALQQGIGKPPLLLRRVLCCDSLGQPGRRLSAPFLPIYSVTPDGVFRVAGFAVSPVVDVRLLYNGFVSSYAFFLFLFHLSCSPLESRSLRVIHSNQIL
jgi:hypothetical protein